MVKAAAPQRQCKQAPWLVLSQDGWHQAPWDGKRHGAHTDGAMGTWWVRMSLVQVLAALQATALTNTAPYCLLEKPEAPQQGPQCPSHTHLQETMDHLPQQGPKRALNLVLQPQDMAPQILVLQNEHDPLLPALPQQLHPAGEVAIPSIHIHGLPAALKY